MFGLRRGFRFFDLHSADRILVCSHFFLRISRLGILFRLSREQPIIYVYAR